MTQEASVVFLEQYIVKYMAFSLSLKDVWE